MPAARPLTKGDIEIAAKTLRAAAISVLGDKAPEPGYGCYVRFVAEEMGVSYDLARAVLRDLRADGNAVYLSGLCDEEGVPAGSGYGLTDAGRSVYDALPRFERETP